MISFAVPGAPVGKGRPRAARVGSGVRMFTPARTVSYEGLIALAAQAAMAGLPLLDGPVGMSFEATFAIPASWSKKRRAAAEAGKVWHTSKPDLDNIVKALGDALNGVVWGDDSHVAMTVMAKRYGPVPGLKVNIYPLVPA